MNADWKMLSVVEDRFQIKGRGVTIVPGVPLGGDWRVRIGDQLRLKRPDGTEIATEISGLEMGLRVPTASQAILLGGGVSKDDVPQGTEVWIFSDFGGRL